MDSREKMMNEHILMRTYQSSTNTSLFAMTTVAIIEVMMLGLSVFNRPMFGPYLWRYRTFYIALLTMVVSYILFTIYIKKDYANRFKALNIVNPLAAIFFFGWAAGITYHDYLIYGSVDPTVFMTFSLSVPSCFYLVPSIYGLIAVLADIMMLFIAAQAPNGVALAINMIIYFVFQMVLGLSMLNVKKILSAEIIKTEDQRDKIEKLSSRQAMFFSSVTHEIRTPVNAILGMDSMILQESKENPILEYAENIKMATNTLLGIINDILDFSKIDAGKMEIVPSEYETESMFHSLVVVTEGRLKGKGLAFEIKIDKDIPSKLFGDEARIRQVITNILTNAVKYTESGSITLEAHARKKDEESVDLCVAVTDTGIGIREEDLEKLFSAFERIDEQRNRNVEGTGLGMTITSNLLSLMGSNLEVESEYGKGSTFSFVLHQKVISWDPMGEFSVRKKSRRRQRRKEMAFSAPEAKVLVVDDNDMNQKVSSKLMGLFGIRPILVNSGAAALEQVRSTEFDMVFLDHMMPEMDGLETFEHMRTESLLPERTKVVALTAKAGPNAQAVYMEAGFTDYLSKPIELDSLEAILQKWLPEEVIQAK